MKKLVVLVAVLALVMSFCLVGCSTTYTGECKYDSYGHTYGVKVDVAVSGGVIKGVKLYSEEETGWVRTSADNADHGWTGHDKTEAAYDDFLKKFVGQKVEDVLAIKATATADGQTVEDANWTISGSTQSSARIIVAVQDALKKASSK